MFFMFFNVRKLANLLLPFVTWMIFFLCFFRIILASDEIMVELNSFDVHRSFLIVFLFLLDILIRNLFLSRYFCAVCSC